MPRLNIIRAWKDENYRLNLSAAERLLLPDHPAGLVELTDADLGATLGGTGNEGTYQECFLGAWAGGTDTCQTY
jgi:mersacidin/lichenicidin family type 2 lantibiotic